MQSASLWQRAARWAAAYFWGYVFALCSAIMASFHAYQSATSQYAVATAAQLALMSIGGSLGLGWAGYIRKKYGMAMAAPTVVGALMCIFVTLWGGLGMFSAKADTTSAERKLVAERNGIDRGKLKRLREERDAIKVRARAVISAELTNMRSLPAFKVSDGCEPDRITATATRELCGRYRLLEADLEQAKEAERLDRLISGLEERLRDAPAEIQPDQQAAAFSTLTCMSAWTCISIEKSQALYALCASIALELIAAGAMVRAQAKMSEWYELEIARALRSSDVPKIGTTEAKEKSARVAAMHQSERNKQIQPAPQPEPRKAAPRRPAPVPAGVVNSGSVVDFLAQSVVRDPTERLTVRATYQWYRDWCKRVSATPASVDKFCRDLEKACEDIGAAIEHDGKLAYCVGVRLADIA